MQLRLVFKPSVAAGGFLLPEIIPCGENPYDCRAQYLVVSLARCRTQDVESSQGVKTPPTCSLGGETWRASTPRIIARTHRSRQPRAVFSCPRHPAVSCRGLRDGLEPVMFLRPESAKAGRHETCQRGRLNGLSGCLRIALGTVPTRCRNFGFCARGQVSADRAGVRRAFAVFHI